MIDGFRYGVSGIPTEEMQTFYVDSINFRFPNVCQYLSSSCIW